MDALYADRLFLLRPGFEDQGRHWFCPFCAHVIGFLAYYPEVRTTLEVVELDFAKPRQPLVDLLGDEHQAPPMLILAPNSPTDVADVDIAEARGHRFVPRTLHILRYLAATRGVAPPH